MLAFEDEVTLLKKIRNQTKFMKERGLTFRSRNEMDVIDDYSITYTNIDLIEADTKGNTEVIASLVGTLHPNKKTLNVSHSKIGLHAVCDSQSKKDVVLYNHFFDAHGWLKESLIQKLSISPFEKHSPKPFFIQDYDALSIDDLGKLIDCFIVATHGLTPGTPMLAAFVIEPEHAAVFKEHQWTVVTVNDNLDCEYTLAYMLIYDV